MPRVTEMIEELAQQARKEGDLVGEQFLAWFLKEQVEEMSAMADLLTTVERAAETNILLAEDYLARETIGDRGKGGDTPLAAGGMLYRVVRIMGWPQQPTSPDSARPRG